MIPLQSGIDWANILSILSNLLAPFIGAIAALILWIHRRINRLEEQQEIHKNSLYGSESDALNEGVIFEVKELKIDIEELSLRIDEVKKKVEELRSED